MPLVTSRHIKLPYSERKTQYLQSGVSDKEITRLQLGGHSTQRHLTGSSDYL